MVGLRPEPRVLDPVEAPLERPAVGLVPETVEDRGLLLEHRRPVLDRREREAVASVLVLMPARAETDVDPATAHPIDRHCDPRKVSRQSIRDRRDPRPEPDRRG